MVSKADQIRVHGLQYLLENLCAHHSMLIVDDVYSTGSSVRPSSTSCTRKTRRNLPQDIRDRNGLVPPHAEHAAHAGVFRPRDGRLAGTALRAVRFLDSRAPGESAGADATAEASCASRKDGRRTTGRMIDDRAFLRMLFDAAVVASKPAACMPLWLEDRPAGNVIVVGAGKAAASMAAIIEQEWAEPLSGLVIVPDGHGAESDYIEVVEAAHPIPDENGVAATRRILDMVSGLSPDDTVVCLFSGGGSSLLCAPASGVTLEQKKAATAELLRSGATIQEMNSARKELSAIKGGKLALACAPANVITLIISDVPGNDPSVVASGPTVVDAASALESDVRILATSDDALQAAALRALESDINPYVLGDLAGDARELAREHAQLAMDIAAGKGPVKSPVSSSRVAKPRCRSPARAEVDAMVSTDSPWQSRLMVTRASRHLQLIRTA